VTFRRPLALPMPASAKSDRRDGSGLHLRHEASNGGVRRMRSSTQIGNAVAVRSPYLDVSDVAERLRCSTRSIHELTRLNRIPHRKLPGGRRCLFLENELRAWEDGADVEVVLRPNGGRIVRPVVAQPARSPRRPTPDPT
jgi:Helix-turn-helix domain